MNLPEFNSALLDQLYPFAISLSLGLLLGLERERHAASRAGLRTFGLTAILGTLSALLGQSLQSAWPVAAGFALTGLRMVAAYFQHPDREDPGTTSVVALMIAFGLGALCWHGHTALAAIIGVVTAILLAFKAELRGMSERLSTRDVHSMLQFLVLTLVVLPILPSTNFGPYDALNLAQIWTMVVLVSGISLAGYAALRITGPEKGVWILGLLGGMVSSTATTMVYSRRARETPANAASASTVILLSNTVVFARLLAVTAVVAPGIFPRLLAPMGAGLAAGIVAALICTRHCGRGGDGLLADVKNPTELSTALSFGGLYALVLFLSAWLSDIAGSKGLYAVALAAGVTDVDAITLSSLRLFNLDRLAPEHVVGAVVLALLSNMVFKGALAVSLGGGALARRVLPGLAAMGLAAGAAALLAP